MSDALDTSAGAGASPAPSPHTTASRYNLRNPAVKRILREMREMAEDTSSAYHAEAVEEDIFEWHFAILGAEDSEFEGGIYHGRVLLPPEYPFKPPSFVLLTPSGRFETNTKICLSITQHHPEHWQPSWSVRTALMAVRAFMPTPSEGAVGSLDYTTEERLTLATASREKAPDFGASAERREVVSRVHAAMLAKWEETKRAKRDLEASARRAAAAASTSDSTSDSTSGGSARVTMADAGREPICSGEPTRAGTGARVIPSVSPEEKETRERPPRPATGCSSQAARESLVEKKHPASPTISDSVRAREEETVSPPNDAFEASAFSSPGAREDVPSARAGPSEPSPEDPEGFRGRKKRSSRPGPSTRAGDSPTALFRIDETATAFARPISSASSSRWRRSRRRDSPEVAKVKQKLDFLASVLFFAAAAILIRRCFARARSGEDS